MYRRWWAKSEEACLSLLLRGVGGEQTGQEAGGNEQGKDRADPAPFPVPSWNQWFNRTYPFLASGSIAETSNSCSAWFRCNCRGQSGVRLLLPRSGSSFDAPH